MHLLKNKSVKGGFFASQWINGNRHFQDGNEFTK